MDEQFSLRRLVDREGCVMLVSGNVFWYYWKFDMDGAPFHTYDCDECLRKDASKMAGETGHPVSIYRTEVVHVDTGVLAEVDYDTYIKSDVWREKASAAKERALWRCQLCNKEGDYRTLHAHHRTYDRVGFEAPEDITVLCAGCHAKFHGKENG